MSNIFLTFNFIKIIIFFILILYIILCKINVIKKDILKIVFDWFDDIESYGLRRLIFSFIATCICLIIIIILNIITNIFNKKNIIDYNYTNSYENNYHTTDYRNLNYIGGTNVYDSKNDLIRWIDLYLDIDTKEVLRGSNNSNYITAGLPVIGTDTMIVPNIRQTKRGFQDYILQWTSSILYDNSNKLIINNYGNSKAVENYNKAIDILCDINWNNKKEYKDNEKYQISTISDVKSNAINDYLLESNGKLNGIEYIYNILRNCFGFISDDFYSLSSNKILFNEIELNEVQIGDIGIKEKNDKIYQIGMCIGYDERNNPIFTLCDSVKNGVPEYLSNRNRLKDKEILGYNILHIEPKDFFDRYIWQKKIFDNYYGTNLPFNTKDVINSNIYNSHDVIHRIKDKDIEKYNNQIFGNVSFKNNDYYIDMSNKIYQERIRRINQREKNAKNLCDEYIIDIKKYENMEIDDFILIYDTNTFEYKNYINKYEDDSIDYYKNKYRKLSKEEKQHRDYEINKELLLDRLNNDLKDIKNLSLDEIYKYYEKKRIIIRPDGKKIIEDFYNSIHLK